MNPKLLALAAIFLRPLGWLYGAIAAARVWAYRRGWLTSHAPGRPTLSIGNLSTGGTGKTPLLLATVDWLEQHHARPGILSRGYGGDEGRLLEERHPQASLAENPDRVAGLGSLLALPKPPEVILLDDGFQHLRLRRHFDVVLLDATRPFGPCLPAGLFRERGRALARADLVVLSRAEWVSEDRRLAIWKRVARYRDKNKDCPRVEGGVEFQSLHSLNGKSSLQPEEVDGQVAWLAAGIGNPESFRALVEAQGVQVLGCQWMADHHPWKPKDWQDWDRHPAIWVTEKDAVKLRHQLPEDLAAKTWSCRVDWRFQRGGEHYWALLERLILPVRAARIEPLWQAHDGQGRVVQ